MDWKTCATDVSPIVQPCRLWQHLGKSDLGQRRLRPRAREAEAFFSRRPSPCDHGAGTNTLEQKTRFWQILLQKSFRFTEENFPGRMRGDRIII
jgi:hypothetical protein